MASISVLCSGSVEQGPYGVNLLRNQLGHTVYDGADAKRQPLIKIRDVLEHRAGYPILKALQLIPRVVKSEAVLCFLEQHAQFPALLKSKNIPPYASKPLAMISCWLAEELLQASTSERTELVKKYSAVDLIFVLSSNQVDILVDAGFPRERVEAIHFGFAPELFSYSPHMKKPGLISAVGFDRGRDYVTLIEAARTIKADIHLYTRPELVAGIDLPSNIIFHGLVPFEEYVKVLYESSILAIPTVELAYPTGQTVALEAAATGAALLLTESTAMRDYFDDQVAYYHPQGDPEAWSLRINQLLEDPQEVAQKGHRASEHVHANFPYLSMWRSIEQSLHNRGWLPATS